MSVYGNAFWEIIKPAETVNLVQNPSIEKAITGWAASGGTAASTSASQFFGTYSLQLTPTTAACGGVYYGANSLPVALTTGCTYAFSAFFKGQANIPYQFYFANTSGTLVGSSLQFTATGSWERKSVTYVETSSASRRLYVTKNNSANTGVFILDGVQCERISGAGASPTTYCDGDQEGCIWLANPHGSRSWRDGESRAGGEIINLNRDYDIIVRQQPGAGMPPVSNVQTSLGIQDGGLFQRTKTEVRTITLEGVVSGSDVNDFHYNRKRLVDLFKPDGGAPAQPFRLRYSTGSAITKQIEAHYDGGFELNQATSNIETFSARFLAYDPYFEEIKDTAQVLTTSQSVTYGLAIKKYDNSAADEGAWDLTAASLTPTCFAFGPDGKLYMGLSTFFVTGASSRVVGSVERYNFQKRASETFLPTVASLQGYTFYGGNLTDDPTIDLYMIKSIAFDSLGNLYIGGGFITANSASIRGIAKWDGSSLTSVANNGVDDAVWAVAVDRNNTLYIGGDFDSAGSVTASRMAKFTVGATEFAQVGDGAASTVRTIGLEKSGSNLYIGGDFTSSGSIAASRFAYFNGTEFSNLGSASINNSVNTMGVRDDDTVYIGGVFTGVFPDSAGSPSYLTHWDGQSYTIGAEAKPQSHVQSLSYDNTRGVLAVATASTGGTATLKNAGTYMFWNGSTWSYSNSIAPHSALTVVASDGRDAIAKLYQAATAAVKSIVNNPGGATAYPKLIWTLPSTTASDLIYFVDNVSASKSVQFNYTLLGGETVTVDTQDGTAKSDARGNIIGNIIQGSNFSTWSLLPGNNIILAFAESASTQLALRWKNRYWSIDG